MVNRDEKSAELTARLDHLPFSKWHRNFFILCFFGIMLDAADYALFGFALPSIAQEFKLNPAEAGLIVTIGLIGATLGAVFWGTISDYIGRRVAFQATVGIFAVFTGFIAASWSVLSLSIFRFISNIGLGGEVPVTSTLAAEFAPGRIRGRMAVAILAAFPIGILIAAGTALLIIPNYGWRVLFVLAFLPGVLLFFTRRYLPESVRFHLSKGRVKEAEETVAHIERQALGRLRTPEEITALPKFQEKIEKGYRVTVFELLSSERWRRTVLLWIVSSGYLWASQGLLFMLPLILRERGIPLTQAITFVIIQVSVAFIGYTTCGFLIDRFGRRPVLFLYFFVGALAHLWFAESSGIWMYFAIAAVGWVNPGVFGSTVIYVNELHPTRLRATAVGWFFGIGRIAAFISPAVIGYMLAYGLGHYALHTAAVAYLIAAIALWFIGIETKGRTLEEIDQAIHADAGASAPIGHSRNNRPG